MKKELIKQFNETPHKIFEINLSSYLELDGDEYYLFHLNTTEEGIEAGSITNVGFYRIGDLIENWDEDYSLDEHLQNLYDKCIEWMLKDFENEKQNEL